MSRYRLQPTPVQERVLLEHCGHARFVWNLAVEQHAHWRPGLKPAPGFVEQCRQLTDARAESAWLRAGSITVQQQALKDFAQAMANFFGKTHRRPTWRRRGRGEGFRIVGGRGRHWDVRRLSNRVGEVKVPKVGWVRFRWSRAVPEGVKSYRITRDAAGRWHVAFAAIPQTILAPGTGEVVGVDRGVAVSAALSTGELLNRPGLRGGERARLLRFLRGLARAKRGSHRRDKVKQAIARLKTREVDRRRDWVEKTSTDLARRFDVIAVEDLKIGNMTRSARGSIEAPGKRVAAKAGLNRSILAAGWGRLVQRLVHKAAGRVVKVNPAYTSQRCSACGIVDAKSRESQADFGCRSRGYACNADVNAARNIRLWSLLRYLGREFLLILSTSSSEAALPRLIAKMEHLGVSRTVAGITVPTGYSFNLDGTAIYLTMATLFIAEASGKPLAIGEQVGLLLFMVIASKGAAGVTGSGLATLAGGLQSHRPDLVDGVGFIVGIDRFMSEARALTNFAGNAVATVLIGAWTRELDRERLDRVLAGDLPFDEATLLDEGPEDKPELVTAAAR